ncbi:MAG: histidine kinase [Negativicutes bacterium]|jgi:sensor histidine kinase YesM
MRRFDKSTETKYRDYCHGGDSLLLGVAVILTVALSITYALFDSSIYVWSGKMISVFLKRGLLVLIAAALWFVFWKKIIRDRWWDHFVLGVGILVSTNYYFIAVERKLYDPQFYQHPVFVSASLFWLVLYTFMVPIYRDLPKIVIAVLFTTIVTARMAPEIMASYEGMALVVSYVLISAICLLISLRSERYRRQIFLQYQQELSTRSALEKALIVEEKLNRTEQMMLKTSAELKLLSAQIKPHFLYNVIGTIAVLCRSNPELAAAVVDSLALYLRGSVNIDREFVSLEEELKVVNAYLYIQSVRMGERMTYEIRNDIDSNLASSVVLPVFAIQTLVENAIIHGLCDYEQYGKVVVVVRVDGNNLLIAVSDNGAGMSGIEIAAVFATANENSDTAERRIGLRNVNRRLVLMGTEGLKFDSAPGSGTTVSFLLPAKVDFAGKK